MQHEGNRLGSNWDVCGVFNVMIRKFHNKERNSSLRNENLLKMNSPAGHPGCRWVCFFIRTDFEKFSIASHAHHRIICSEWVPSEWVSKQLIKMSRNKSVIKINKLQINASGKNMNRRKCHLVWIRREICKFQGLCKSEHGPDMFKTLTDGLEWCGLLWCFYQLFGLSFWRHPFTADDPLVNKWFNDTFLQICSDKDTSSSTS